MVVTRAFLYECFKNKGMNKYLLRKMLELAKTSDNEEVRISRG
jgi:hypothetical protein